MGQQGDKSKHHSDLPRSHADASLTPTKSGELRRLHKALLLAKDAREKKLHAKKEELKRLKSKTLDAQFRRELEKGLNCSPFEAEAVCELVKEIYFPYFDMQI